MNIDPSVFEEKTNGIIRPSPSRRRNGIDLVTSFLKLNFVSSLEKIIKERIFKVELLDKKDYQIALNKIAQTLSEVSQKLSSLKIEIPKIEVPATHINLKTPNDEEILSLSASLEELTHSSTSTVEYLNGVQKLLQTSIEELKRIGKINPNFVQPIKGKVEIANFPSTNFDAVIKGLREVEFAIRQIKIDIPKQSEIKIPPFPSTINFTESKAILKALKDVSDKLNELPKRFPEIDFPREISVSNFPPQKYPMPVSNININPLRGYAKSRNITITTSITPLPDEVLAYRRSLIVFNNSTQTIYIGGSDVTTTNGLPVPKNTYSPPVDAGPKLIVYGIVASGTADTRVLELSNENIGG